MDLGVIIWRYAERERCARCQRTTMLRTQTPEAIQRIAQDGAKRAWGDASAGARLQASYQPQMIPLAASAARWFPLLTSVKDSAALVDGFSPHAVAGGVH